MGDSLLMHSALLRRTRCWWLVSVAAATPSAISPVCASRQVLPRVPRRLWGCSQAVVNSTGQPGMLTRHLAAVLCRAAELCLWICAQVVKVAGGALLALFKGKKEKPRS